MSTSTSDSWFLDKCKELESEIGRGWKRALAEKVGVGESNVQVWLKSGRVPAAVRRAIELSDEVDDLQRRVNESERLQGARWICEERVGGTTTFSVYEMNRKTGRARLIATGIPELKDAHAIADIPEVEQILSRVHFTLQMSNDEEDIELCRSIEAWPEGSAWEKLAAEQEYWSESAKQIQEFSK